MGGKLRCFFATLYPEMVDKLIIADIAPKFYPQHHQSILGGLNAVDFQRNQADLKWKKPPISNTSQCYCATEINK
jgi:hypothetical protein